jgi:hypothetical protein
MNIQYLPMLLLALLIPIQLQAETLKERQGAFQSVLNKEKTDQAKIKKAEFITLDTKSRFRVDAINYLIDKKSVSSGSVFVQLMKDPQLSEFAIFGVGEVGFYEATPLLIKYMKDENRNNRGNAYRSLQKLYPEDFNFEFHHDDPEFKRNQVVESIQSWWKDNGERLKNRELQKQNQIDKKEAEIRWEKYGKEYLERP